ncbi:SDR family NAD(P)-dependent oxidoreductase [uncultured Cellulomonas sp.]|uniref:SDR family NAD(P)-dependent oxidoreductase n=1 Tax=uncultured Cellulomonas sp. TaxID=189682 RepID=UPI0028ECE416|nr:SDR family NAD(P)-dependent oxidoreductase [uncultured Cellulomonas sp.]
MTTTGTTTTIALVTGATQGLGLETVRRLAGLGWTVWLGARDLTQGARLADELDGDVRPVQLDVTDEASVTSAARTVEAGSGRLDVLVNNAGIAGTHAGPRETAPDDFLPVFGVNVLGPVRVTHTFLPLLDRSAQPRVVMVSSGLGSLAITNDPSRLESTLHVLVYPSSKAALNMITTQYARSLPGYQVNVVDPGYTGTALNGFTGTQTVQEGTEAVVAAATLEPGAPTGTFTDRAGALPW